MDETSFFGWVAREDWFSRKNRLYLFKNKPNRDGNFGWEGDVIKILDSDAFPNLKWKDEPIKVEITVRKSTIENIYN